MKPSQWNLVVICLDTFRYDLLNHRAAWSVELPHLDRLRRESVQFTHAFGEGEPTIPTRRAFFTGERSFPWRYRFDTKGMWPTGRGWHKIPPEQPTMAEILLRQGYQTGLISDNYHLFKPTVNFTRGFLQYEFVRGYESDNYRGGVITTDELARYVREPDPLEHATLIQYLLNTRGRKREEDWHTAQTFARAASWIRDHQYQETQPFFLWVDSFGPHEPWDPPRDYLKRYISNHQAEILRFAQDDNFEGIECIYPVGLTAKELSELEQRRVRELYLAYLAFVDHWVGHFLDVLAQSGLDQQTIVMLVSDHGTELMDHGQFSKSASHLYAHNTKLCWLIRHPDRFGTDSLVQRTGQPPQGQPPGYQPWQPPAGQPPAWHPQGVPLPYTKPEVAMGGEGSTGQPLPGNAPPGQSPPGQPLPGQLPGQPLPGQSPGYPPPGQPPEPPPGHPQGVPLLYTKREAVMIGAGGECDAFVQNHDLFPTALALLGVAHDGVAGTNAWQWVEDADVPRREYVITGWGSYAAVRDRQWNYFVNFEEPDAEEFLFDLQADPGEYSNVAQKYASERQYRRKLLEEFLGQALPARLNDQVIESEAPIRVYFGSTIDQAKRDAGFV